MIVIQANDSVLSRDSIQRHDLAVMEINPPLDSPGLSSQFARGQLKSGSSKERMRKFPYAPVGKLFICVVHFVCFTCKTTRSFEKQITYYKQSEFVFAPSLLARRPLYAFFETQKN